MTRKQALLKAINECNDPEAKEKLLDLYNEMPLVHWSKKSIIDTLENYYIETGRRPTVSTLRAVPEMPSHPAIKVHFGINAKEFLELLFPPEKSEEEIRREYNEKVIKDFIEEYNRIKPSSSDDYNERRNRKCKCAMTVMKVANCKWSELMQKYDLPKYVNQKPKTQIDIVPSITVTYNGKKL